ncbi:MAG: sigma-70 family RNA polymerase sigma factor [Clostridia bacterium]|nr:sigma-70 family RNA polymerase sigma factor [Clostridia bacterium]
MENTSVRPTDDAEKVVRIYGDMLLRICFVMLGNEADAEDAVQETIIRYFRKAPTFESCEHEKAWLIVAAKNICRDIIRFRQRHPQTSIEYLQLLTSDPSDSGILEALMSLPEKFRLVLNLYYFEGYRFEDISKMISRTPSAVKMRLQKGRKLLEEKYRKEYL